MHDPTWRWWEQKTQYKVGGQVGSWWRDSTETRVPSSVLADHPVHPGLLLLPIQQLAGGGRRVHRHEQLPKALQHLQRLRAARDRLPGQGQRV